MPAERRHGRSADGDGADAKTEARMAAFTATPLTPQQLAGLARLVNRATLYEIEIIAADGRKALLCYTPLRTGLGLRNGLLERGAAVAAFLGAPSNAKMKSVRGCHSSTHEITGGGLIRFSGRTKRDVIMADTPLPYVAQEG